MQQTNTSNTATHRNKKKAGPKTVKLNTCIAAQNTNLKMNSWQLPCKLNFYALRWKIRSKHFLFESPFICKLYKYIQQMV
jgi:hypothetical protein